MTDQNQTRWQTCIHEAGHCVAGIALGGECSYLIARDQGVAGITGLDETAKAFCATAGPMAAEMLADCPIPEPTVKPIPLADNYTSTPTEQLLQATSSADPSPSDDEIVACWAIAGVESEPERWAERVAFAKHTASKIIHDHEGQIIALATALFHQHLLPGSTIQTILENTK